jgi:AmmeMemoRadiSam system protein B
MPATSIPAARPAKPTPCSHPLAGRIRRVVLLGPCHRVAVRGLATPTVQAFATPLGNIPLDRAALDALADLPQVVASDAAHAQEHSLEVQLPFLQTVLGEFKLVPLAVGQTGAAEVAQVITRLWGGPETLIVISSDLSHFHGYAEAQKIDHATADHILALEQLTSFEQACGALPINGLIAVARQRGLRIERIAQCNSGDTAGDKSRVVGYASFALYEPEAVTADPGPALLVRARNAIAARLGQPTQAEPAHPGLNQPGATFVTLTQNGAASRLHRLAAGASSARPGRARQCRRRGIQRSALPAAQGRGTAAHPRRSLAADRAATDDIQPTKPTPCASCGRMSTA